MPKKCRLLGNFRPYYRLKRPQEEEKFAQIPRRAEFRDKGDNFDWKKARRFAPLMLREQKVQILRSLAYPKPGTRLSYVEPEHYCLPLDFSPRSIPFSRQ